MATTSSTHCLSRLFLIFPAVSNNSDSRICAFTIRASPSWNNKSNSYHTAAHYFTTLLFIYIEITSQPVTETVLYKSVSELGRMIRTKQVSPVELTSEYLRRAQKLDPQLLAFVTITEDLVNAQARAAEKEVMKGKLRGPLHGIPWGVKDLFATSGIPTQ